MRRQDEYATITTTELRQLRDYYQQRGLTACLAHAQAVLAGRN